MRDRRYRREIVRIGIDASNIGTGGGGTHLVQFLSAAEPGKFGVSQVLVWGARSTLAKLPRRDWLKLSQQGDLEGSLLARLFWQKYRLHELAKESCDLLFVPGGSYPGNFRPYVTMFQNMLPFDSVEAARYGTSWMRLRLMILRSIQMSTFTSANGVIFLSEQARERLMQTAVKLRGRNTVIPHGVEPRFMMPPRPQKALAYYSMFRPFRLLYVSIVDVYKHQWKVAEAVARLRRRGYPVQMDLVGSSYAPALRRLNRTLQRVDRGSAFIRYRGSYPHSDLGEIYHDSDAFVFASSCENMPNILLEAMASALPIASSNRDPMPSVLGNAAFYFNPESVSETENAIETMLMDVDGRQRSAQQAYDAAQKYSWRTCTDQIFQFLVEVGRNCN